MLLDVSLCLTVWTKKSVININPKILWPRHIFLANTSYNISRSQFSRSFGKMKKMHYCAEARCRPFCSTREKISATTIRTFYRIADLYGRRLVVCVHFSGRKRNIGIYWARECVSWSREHSTSVLDEYTFHSVCLFGKNNAADTIIPTQLKHQWTEVFESWFGQISHSALSLTCMCSIKVL